MAQNLNDLDFSIRKYDGWQQVQKDITFNGTLSGAIGDLDGLTGNNPFSIFTVTGSVKAKVVGICTTTLSGNTALVEVGVTGSTSGIIAQTTVDNIDANEVWCDATPVPIELSSALLENIIASNIIGTVSTADVQSGVVKFICSWRPLSNDGNVVAA